MESNSDWIKYRDELCYPVEKYLLGYAVRDKERLISAIISNAFLNVKDRFEQLKQIPADPAWRRSEILSWILSLLKISPNRKLYTKRSK